MMIHMFIIPTFRSRPSTGSYSNYSESEALYARVRRVGRGGSKVVINTSSEVDMSEEPMLTTSSSSGNLEDNTPLVTSYSTESDDMMGLSMETTLVRESSAEDGSLSSHLVVCVDRESRV